MANSGQSTQPLTEAEKRVSAIRLHAKRYMVDGRYTDYHDWWAEVSAQDVLFLGDAFNQAGDEIARLKAGIAQLRAHAEQTADRAPDTPGSDRRVARGQCLIRGFCAHMTRCISYTHRGYLY